MSIVAVGNQGKMPAQETENVLIGGRYALRSAIARGGMGVVWRAEDTLLRRRVAVKEVEFPPELSEADRSFLRARVLREARAAGRLNHPAAVTIYDVLQEEGKAYIVMELVDAENLEGVVEREGPMAPERAAEIALELVGTLEAAHKEGIVHRDVKPSNVMLASDGRIKLADFGIASLKDDPKITTTGLVMGSPAYMAPEQAQGDGSNPASDLWGLGATLYFAVEGRPPFDKGQPIATLAAVVYEDPPAPNGGELTPVIMRLLSKDPERRPRGVELQTRLHDVISHAQRGVDEAPTTVAAAAPVTTAQPETIADDSGWGPEPPADERDRTGERVSRLKWAAIGGVVVLLVGLVALMLAGLPSDERAAETSGGRARTDATEDNASPASAGAETPAEQGEEPAGEVAETPTTAAVPDEWSSYTHPASGYQAFYPSGWTPVVLDENRVDFRDPSSHTYLRVGWTDSPGPSPVGAWEELSDSFGARHDNYDEIRIVPTTYKGYDAAIWEFTWSEGGVDLHAVDLGFVTGDHGFALNFVTEEDDWAASQPLFKKMKRRFVVPG